MSLSKEKAEVNSHTHTSNDLTVAFSKNQLWGEVIGKSYGKGIIIEIRQYNDSTREAEFLKYLSVGLTFEELEMIYNIAKEKRFETIAERSTTQQGEESKNE